jgi:YbbR domain-containing protein
VRAPYGVDVIEVSPATVSLGFETSGLRTVKIVPVLIGRPMTGYVAGDVSVDPPEVEVVGPVSRLDELGQATTEPVSVENATGTVIDRVTVGVDDSELRLSRPVTARVTVQVVPAPVERTLEAVPVRYENLREGLRATIRPTSVGVVLRGAQRGLAAVAPADVELVVDLGGLGRGTHTREIRAGASPRFEVVGVVPSTVRVQIR